MRPLERAIERLRQAACAFYRWLTRLKINAHQQFAYFKNRYAARHQQESSLFEQTLNGKTNVELQKHSAKNQLGHSAGAAFGSSSVGLSTSTQTSISLQQTQTALSSGSLYVGSKPIKTPRTRKFKLFSFLKRLSPRNFMDYCVIALNEASGSASSNRFDLSSCNSSIWLLGRQYELPDDSDRLIEDIRSKLWITYRRNFPPIDENTRYTTDRGFGCMIRCGQMVLANALLSRNLGRDWRWSPKGLETNPEVYTKILKLFQDRDDCLYSIHRIVQTGRDEGKSVGEWFGPNTIAQALKRMSTSYLASRQIDNELVISIDAALDNMVVIDEVKARFKKMCKPLSAEPELDKNGDNLTEEQEHGACHSTNSTTTTTTTTGAQAAWIPGILFIQLRLGLTKINPLYFAALKKTFQFENSLGIIGGRPNHALYLVGYAENDIIYLDPHSTQQYIDFDDLEAKHQDKSQQQEQSQESTAAADSGGYQSSSTSEVDDASDSTYHCSCPEKMPLDRLDPSLALCFYFNAEEDFDRWCNSSQELLVSSEQAPMFEITKSRPSDWNLSLTSRTMSKSSSDHDEEFEILT